MDNKKDNLELQNHTMENSEIDNLICPLEEFEDLTEAALLSKNKQKKIETDNLICPLEEFEDLTEAALLDK